MCLLQSPGYPKRDKREPLPYWVDVQADPSLCWSHRSYCRFCRALALFPWEIRTVFIWLPSYLEIWWQREMYWWTAKSQIQLYRSSQSLFTWLTDSCIVAHFTASLPNFYIVTLITLSNQSTWSGLFQSMNLYKFIVLNRGFRQKFRQCPFVLWRNSIKQTV